MKIAVFSDIHANHEALKSVIKDAKNQKVDKIICLGDIVGKGANPHKCIHLVRENCDMVVRGNMDERMSEDPTQFADNPIEQERIKFNQSLMTAEDIEYLKNLPTCIEFYLSGNFVRLYHSDPNDLYKLTYETKTKLYKINDFFKGGKLTISDKIADIVVFGHIHYQCLKKVFNRTLLNCGSVGSSACAMYDKAFNADPKEMKQAHYLILDGKLNEKIKLENIGIEFRSVNYNITKELNSAKNILEYDIYAEEVSNACYRGIKCVKKRLEDDGYSFNENVNI